MALRQLVITKKLQALRKKLDDLMAKDAEFEQRKEELKIREAELEEAVSEVTEETSEEDKAAIDESVEEFEKDQEALNAEIEDHESEKKKLEDEIQQLQAELEELNSRAVSSAPEHDNHENHENHEKREGGIRMIRRGFFAGMNRGEVKSLIAREDVKDFLTRVRNLMGEKRAVTGAELTIPDVLLDLLRDNLHRYSKLISKVRYKPLKGTARQNIVGAIPEGIWTEMVGTLNELDIVFNQVEVDGYKVGGFIPIPNSTIEDSEENLANEVMDAIAQGIGLAVDKAILYGTGVKMPVGIVTRLAEVAQPPYWGVNERPWTNLSATNLLAIDPAAITPADFFADLILKLGVAQANYSDGNMFWAMSTQTYRYLQSKAINFNAAGAVVAGVQNTMPVIGGEAVLLDFIPLYHVIGGYGSLYLLAERGGIKLAQSEHVQFIQDNTVFKGTARFDGRPIFGEAFVGLTVDQGAGAAVPDPGDVVFPPDVANP